MKIHIKRFVLEVPAWNELYVYAPGLGSLHMIAQYPGGTFVLESRLGSIGTEPMAGPQETP